MSVLPLRPFGVSDQLWPPGMCEACYEPQWSDALHDWEYVEDPRPTSRWSAAKRCSAMGTTNQLVAVHTGGYRLGPDGVSCGRLTSLNHRLDTEAALDWINSFL